MQTPLHPILEAHAIHHLNVGGGHTLYVEESGNPSGLPALFLHGGPGSGTEPAHRGYFNPAIYRIILLDQRGCGQSTAANPLENNTTQLLLEDLETVRQHLDIPQWHVVAGWSWGAALSLLYAQAHPQAMRSLVLSSVFLADDDAIAQLHAPASIAHAPQAYAGLTALIPHPTPENIQQALYGPQAQQVALAHSLFDAAVMEPSPDMEGIRLWLSENPDSVLKNARLVAHYMAHRCFLQDKQILNNLPNLEGKPVFLSHGTLDLCCLPSASEAVHAALPTSSYTRVTGAGHRSTDALKTQRRLHLDAAAKLFA